MSLESYLKTEFNGYVIFWKNQFSKKRNFFYNKHSVKTGQNIYIQKINCLNNELHMYCNLILT